MTRKSLRHERNAPAHPGQLLREVSFPALGKSIAQIAEDLHVSRQSLYELTRGKRAMSEEMALRIGKYLGNGPEFWMAMQTKYNLWKAEKIVDLTFIEAVHG